MDATAAGTSSGSAGRRAAGVGLLLLVPAAGGVAVPTATAHAAERVVTITPSGVVPSRLEVAPGDTVRFVSQDATFAYRAQSTGGAWSFDSGPTELLDGDYTVPTPVVQPGTYSYRVAQDGPFHGSVVLPGAAAPGSADGPAGAGASGGAGAGAGRAPGDPGTVAPTGPAAVDANPPAAAASDGAPPAAGAVPGQLPGADTARGLGLPVALAALFVLGTASLLVRLVLTEAARSSRRDGDTAARW